MAGCLLLHCIVFSQQVHFGLRAGLSLANASIDFADEAYRFDPKMRQGIILGMMLDIGINKYFSFCPGVNLVGKGTKQLESNGANVNFFDQAVHYFDFPLDLVYKVKLKQGRILLGAGPVIGIRSNNSYYYFFATTKTDIGANVLAAYELPIGMSFNVNYTHGVKNLSVDKVPIRSFRNRYIGLTVCYLF